MIHNLPTKLRELRKRNNLSQKDVAERLNVSPSIISSYETGERTPSIDNLLALSYLYRCSTDYLLGKITEVPDIILDTQNLNDEQVRALQAFIKTIKHE